MPTVSTEVTPGQALGEPTLASDAHSGSETSAARSSGGTKRKAEDMESVEPSQGARKLWKPIKLEPGSPAHLNFRDSMEDQAYDIDEDEGTTTMRPSKIPLAAEVRLAISRDTSVPLERGTETTARASQHNTKGGTNGLLRHESKPDNFKTPCRRKASRTSKDPRSFSRSNIEDVCYDSIPDYAPPISTLSTDNPHILQVEWRKKSYIDLSKDPDRHMLHEAELELASILDLSCAKYLCIKRRIFQACVKALQAGREFRRVDSQKACKIDNNKVSKLCRAWERVGWFDKKYFVKYLDESNSTLGDSNSRNNERDSTASGLTELDIWDVSESEFHFTSEGDEESTDEDTADSSGSFDGEHDETGGWKKVNSYPDTSLRSQRSGFPAVGESVGHRRVLNDGKTQSDSALPRKETVNESPTTEVRRPRQGAELQESVSPENFNRFSGDDNDQIPVVETRSMTEKTRAFRNCRSGDEAASIPTAKAKNDQQKLSLEEPYPRTSSTSRFNKRIPIPHSLDEANAADIMLVKMKEENRPWLEIMVAWEKVTGKAHSAKSLLCRSNRIMANIASSRLKSEKGPGRNVVFTNSRLKPEDDQLLLTAEAEVETKFQREKADILAEIESNFQSEKWKLVAEAMSRTGSATYSAESIQTQYEKLTKSTRVDSPHEDDHDTFVDVPRRTTRVVGEKTSAMSTPSRTSTVKLDEASNRINSPAGGTERGRQTALKGKSQSQIEHSARMRKVWAKRRAQGTNGHHGGPPKASTISKKAKTAAFKTTPYTGTFLAPAITYQSGHAQDSSPSPKPPVMCEQQIGRDTNQHQLSLAQIVPAAAQVSRGLDHSKSSRKVSMAQKPGGVLTNQTQQGAKRQTCRKCGMSYADKANHYRMLPNIGSEHRRRMDANSAAARGHLVPTTKDIGVEGASDTRTGQMVFKISSRD